MEALGSLDAFAAGVCVDAGLRRRCGLAGDAAGDVQVVDGNAVALDVGAGELEIDLAAVRADVGDAVLGVVASDRHRVADAGRLVRLMALMLRLLGERLRELL